MVTSSPPPVSHHRLAHQARERFVHSIDGAIVELMAKINAQLSGLVDGGGRVSQPADMRRAMDALSEFQRERQNWVANVRQGWRNALTARPADGRTDQGALGLLDDEVVERKIIASRLATTVTEAAGEEYNSLRLRIQALERTTDLAKDDVFRPDTLAQLLVKSWTDCGMSRANWAWVHGAVSEVLAARMTGGYKEANAFLVQHGVMAEIDMKQFVRRTEGAGGQHERDARPTGRQDARPQWRDARTGMAAGPATSLATRLDPASSYLSDRGMPLGEPQTVRPSALARAAQETRMLTGVTPMARVRQRAQGVLGQLKRLMSDRVADFDSGVMPSPPSPQLARALAEQLTPFAVTELMPRDADATVAVPVAQVENVATRLRQRATELKAKADKPSEKAIIEIVALMFQAILAEERIAAAIRVWFARLQIPVLRLALAEPDFFASVQHPARQLIDRMGACVLGFDAAQVAGSRLEREVKRIVQVIEQYPETGRRVYQLVLDEFKKFLGRSLTENGNVQQAATLAQQVEQKEALAIQYTIELRRMLEPVPVAPEVREFLFRIWSEVLAMAAVRRGPQHAETMRYKQAAADLLWAVSPKPDRADRSRVVQKLSDLLHVLREGMTMVAISTEEQDGHVKLVNDAVMQAFVSRNEGLAQSKLDELARGLAGLEDVVTDDPEGDMLLDPDMIEMMFGVEGDAFEVIAAGGSQPSDGMLEWAYELELGTWFSLDYQGAVVQVQYVWRSQRGQLHLFSSSAGKSYLVQTRRLASYLQAGLLVPIEDEALTVRATREALAKLNAEPDRLLQ